MGFFMPSELAAIEKLKESIVDREKYVVLTFDEVNVLLQLILSITPVEEAAE